VDELHGVTASVEHPTQATHTAEQPRARPTGRRLVLWDILETVVLALVLFVAIREVILNYRVDGSSMEPTLHNGEMLIVNRRAYMHVSLQHLLGWVPSIGQDVNGEWYPFGPPQRGDIIVFYPPGNSSEPYVKRIIGLPGEHIAIHDGAVYINGQRLIEPYLDAPTLWRGVALDHDYVVPPGYVFVLGDNRNNSSDSRIFGAVPMSSIVGKAWITYWPPDEIKILSHPAYAFQ
jgi:signal peptidase I